MDELLGRDLDVLVPNIKDLAFTVEPFTDSVSDSMAQEREWYGVSKLGAQFPVEMSLSPLQTADGPIKCVVIRDIAKRRQMEDILARAQKMEAIGLLAAGIAHEINTPAQYITDNARFVKESLKTIGELAMREFSGSEFSQSESRSELEDLLAEARLAVDQTLEGMERIVNIVKSIKEFTHPGSGAMTAIDVNRALELAAIISKSEWKNVADMVTNFDPNIPPLVCLAAELNQVFLNIIVNAAHAIAESSKLTGKRGTITLATRSTGDSVEIRIGDTGAGIPKAIQPKVFDLFFTTKEAGRGTGQGLSLAYSIVVGKHNGTITFESREGIGTTFIIAIPNPPAQQGP
jgi:signal transduction histidine kinase